jgi:hypothetical protein
LLATNSCKYLGKLIARLTSAGADSAYRRSLYRGFFVLIVGLFRVVALQTRRGGSAFPSAIYFGRKDRVLLSFPHESVVAFARAP